MSEQKDTSERLAGKRIVVTGASRGIGLGVALACARQGALVGVNCRQPLSDEDEGHRELRERGAEQLLFDVREPEAVNVALDDFAERQGGINGLVNNAGVVAPGLLVMLGDEQLRQVVDTNLMGSLYCTRAALRAMVRQRGGTVLNIGSVSAQKPWRGQTAYAATKGALESLTRALAVEYGKKGIRSACVCPGPVQTDMLGPASGWAGVKGSGAEQLVDRVPLRRLGRVDDVAAAVVFLLSDEAGWMTGGVIHVDGGFLYG